MLLGYLTRRKFTLLGLLVGMAIVLGLFFRGENTRTVVTEVRNDVGTIEHRVRVVERSACSGLTAVQCVRVLFAVLPRSEREKLRRQSLPSDGEIRAAIRQTLRVDARAKKRRVAARNRRRARRKIVAPLPPVFARPLSPVTPGVAPPPAIPRPTLPPQAQGSPPASPGKSGQTPAATGERGKNEGAAPGRPEDKGAPPGQTNPSASEGRDGNPNAKR